MDATATDFQRRILYILHVGLTEIRNLALGEHEQIADLADALEILPGLLDRSEGEDKHDLIRFVLKTYQEKHNSNCDFPRRFEEFEVPKHF